MTAGEFVETLGRRERRQTRSRIFRRRPWPRLSPVAFFFFFSLCLSANRARERKRDTPNCIAASSAPNVPPCSTRKLSPPPPPPLPRRTLLNHIRFSRQLFRYQHSSPALLVHSCTTRLLQLGTRASSGQRFFVCRAASRRYDVIRFSRSMKFHNFSSR